MLIPIFSTSLHLKRRSAIAMQNHSSLSQSPPEIFFFAIESFIFGLFSNRFSFATTRRVKVGHFKQRRITRVDVFQLFGAAPAKEV
jgi:hypothetical protein